MRSLFALRQNQYDRAAAEIRRAVELQPDSPGVRVQGATLLRRMGQYAESEAMARKAMELDAEHPDAIRLVAELAWEGVRSAPRSSPAQRDEAIELYERLVELGEDDDVALQRLASLKLDAGDRDGALDIAARLVARRPGDRNAAASLAQLLLQEGREREALRVALRFVAGHPDDEPLVELCDRLARANDDWEVVVDELAEARRNGSPPLERLLAEAYLALGREREAADALEAALRSSPGDPAVRYNLAGAYRRMGRLADSAALMRALAEEEPADPRVFLMLAETLDDQDEKEGALNAFNTALRVLVAKAGDEVAALRDAIRRRMASLYIEQSRYVAAERLIGELEQPDRTESIEIRANLALAGEEWPAVRQAVKRLRSRGAVGMGAFLEARMLVATGRLGKAQERFEEAIAELGPFTRVRAAEIYLEAERPERGEALLRSWVAAEPESERAHYYLGSFLYRTDRAEEAEISLREAFRLNPHHAPALNFLGYSLAERNQRLDEALELVRRALKVDGWNGAYLDSLGWVYFQMGRYDEARGPLERAAREYPNDVTVLEHLGDVYLELGERALAREAWVRALDAGSENEESLRAKLAKAEADAEEDAENEPAAAESRGEIGPPPLQP
jgi:tetratricopeptide (TPR) repeat protein